MTKLRVKELCKNRGISLADLADAMNVSPSALSQSLKNPSLSKLEEIAKCLEVNVSELFENNKQIILGCISIDGDIYPVQSKLDLENVLAKLNNEII